MRCTFTVIGCRAGSPDENGPASGYVVEAEGVTVLVDCGPGVVLALAAAGLINSLNAAIITHQHADHCADVVALAYHLLFPHRRAPVPLFSAIETKQVLDSLDELFGIPSLPVLSKPVASALPFTELKPGSSTRIGDLRVDTIPAIHPVPTMSLRFPDLGLVYSSDGAISDELVRFSADARVLVAEATYVANAGHDLDRHGHMTAALAGLLAQRARAKQLVLTHLSDFNDGPATVEAAARVYSGPISLAVPGLKVILESESTQVVEPDLGA